MLYCGSRATRLLPACAPAPKAETVVGQGVLLEACWSAVNPAGCSVSRLQGRLDTWHTRALKLHACYRNTPAAGAGIAGVQGLPRKACVPLVCSASCRR